MTTVRLKAQVSPDELLKAVDQLSLADLARFVSRVLALQARRQAPSLPPEEADLLLQINQGIPAHLQPRYEELIAKREAETLTLEDHAELLRLTAHVEDLEARRVEHLARLARVRGISLSALMENLGI